MMGPQDYLPFIYLLDILNNKMRLNSINILALTTEIKLNIRFL
jgi:hypothetical protein